jgi:hypothetical protein
MKNVILGSAMVTLIVIGAVCGFMLLATTDLQQVISTVGQRGWNTVASAEEGGGTVGVAAGGVLQVYVYAHSADPAVDYATNLTNVTGALCYAWANNLNAAMTGNVPYATTFDLVYKIRVNVSEAYNTTGSAWMTAWVRSNITCANLAIGADTAMVGVQIVNNTNFMWMNFYINNGGAGYTITHGQQVNITSYKLQCWM